MYSFFVLGLIPGTTIQITFQLWLDSLLLCVDIAGIWWLYQRHESELTPYLNVPVVHEFSNAAYQNARKQFKTFLMNQVTIWQEL